MHSISINKNISISFILFRLISHPTRLLTPSPSSSSTHYGRFHQAASRVSRTHSSAHRLLCLGQSSVDHSPATHRNLDLENRRNRKQAQDQSISTSTSPLPPLLLVYLSVYLSILCSFLRFSALPPSPPRISWYIATIETWLSNVA